MISEKQLFINLKILNMFQLTSILGPNFVIVVLPICIVWIIFHTISNRDNKNAEVIIKAIECNPSINAENLVSSLEKKEKTLEQFRQIRIFRSCFFFLLGIVMGVFSGILA